MAEPTDAPAVKLICGMISSRVEWLDAAGEELTRAFGAVDRASEAMDFDFTHYYDEEMGSRLHRRFVAFGDCVRPDALVEAKWTTNTVEGEFTARLGGRPPRPINLDAGYVEPSKLVLASMKNFSHRIYLGRGVYAEVTLMYRHGSWQPLDWTFPDYRSGRYDAFLTAARNLLIRRAAGEVRR